MNIVECQLAASYGVILLALMPLNFEQKQACQQTGAGALPYGLRPHAFKLEQKQAYSQTVTVSLSYSYSSSRSARC